MFSIFREHVMVATCTDSEDWPCHRSYRFRWGKVQHIHWSRPSGHSKLFYYVAFFPSRGKLHPPLKNISEPQDFDTNYSVRQQSWQPMSSARSSTWINPQYVWDTSNSSITHTTSATLEGSIRGLRLWNISTNCGISEFVSRVFVWIRISAPRYADGARICGHAWWKRK